MSATSSGETASARASTSPLGASLIELVEIPQVDDGPDRRQVARGPQVRDLGAAQEAVLDDREGRVRPVDDVGDLGPGVAGVDRHEHAAGVRHGQGRDGPVGAVRPPHAHPVAGSEAEADVAAGGVADPVQQGPVGEADAALDVRRVVAEALRGGAEDGGQRGVQTKHLLGRLPLVDLTHSEEDRAFRAEVRGWLEEHLSGEFADLRGLGGAGRDHEAHDERVAWNRHLAEHGWTCLGWPTEHGGRGLSLMQQVIFHEEYARADAPARVNHLGEELLGPTLIAFGTEAQQRRFLPPIVQVAELWCQGYSEPGAGSDLANVQTKGRLVSKGPTQWVVDGQKVWTSNAHFSDWCFVLARTEPGSRRHEGLSFLLVPLDQDGVEVRPIEQLTGGSEFNEVFFTGATTDADLVVGEPGQGWRVAMGLLGFERGVSVLGQIVGFARELAALVELARRNGTFEDPLVRDRLANARVGLEVMRLNALRGLSAVVAGEDSSAGGGAASIAKLVWASWHQQLGELAMDVAGPDGLTARPGATYDLTEWQRLYLFSRADTIYGGSDEVQRNILAERVLGLPREPKGTDA